ncbi:MAG: DUF1700 domain-containing protein [Clostridia bacterium]|nr:DUF1700 domain-containing protein [Clostridia bacterium]
MTKKIFLEKLENGLSGLPREDIQEKIAFYSEMIDDKMEDGKTEQEAVSETGSVEDIVSQLASVTPLKKLVKEKIRPVHKLGALEITLIVLGFPLWFPLIVAVAAVVLSLYVSVWAVVISLWAVVLSLFTGFIGGLAGAVVFAVQDRPLSAGILLSSAIILSGLAIFMFLGCKALSRGLAAGTKKAVIRLKSSLIRKGRSQ